MCWLLLAFSWPFWAGTERGLVRVAIFNINNIIALSGAQQPDVFLAAFRQATDSKEV